MKIINCPVCGARVSGTALFCTECGHPLDEFHKKAKKQPTLQLWALSVLLLVCCVGLFFGIKKLQPSPNTASSALQSVPTGSVETPAATASEAQPTTSLPAASGSAVTEFPASTSPTGQTTTTEIPTSNSPSSDSASPVGVYSGNDHEILVLCEDGTANYYCHDLECLELGCPWSYENHVISITLSKLHCQIQAAAADGSFSELLFKSNSRNWNAEYFQRLSVDPADYLSRKVSSYDSKVEIISTGEFLLPLDGLTYTIPRYFCDFPDEFDESPNSSAFLDIDTDSDFGAALLFYAEQTPLPEAKSPEALTPTAQRYVSGFIKDPVLSDVSVCQIGGRQAYRWDLSGQFSEFFAVFRGYAAVGNLTAIFNETNQQTTFILFLQFDHRSTDLRPDFEQLLSEV